MRRKAYRQAKPEKYSITLLERITFSYMWFSYCNSFLAWERSFKVNTF